jgi:hypothetical protein
VGLRCGHGKRVAAAYELPVSTRSGPSHFSKPVIGAACGGMIALSLLPANVGVCAHGVDIGHFADPHMLKEGQTMTP